MSTRISSAFCTILFLAGCGGPQSAENTTAQQDAAHADDAGLIACAPGNAADFARACTLDRVTGGDGLTLVVHNPDGGFHRLRVTTDGHGVVAADGAQQARVTITGPGQIEVAIGGDRYRLPATIRAQGEPAS
jgi:hypothetical protein